MIQAVPTQSLEANLISPKASVVIPVYNGEKTLAACLESILEQPYGNFEIIVVNNQSTDRTLEIAQSYKNKFSNVLVVNEEKKSRGAARNCGILASQGDYILMTDCDCVVPLNWISDLLHCARKFDGAIIMGGEVSLRNNYWSQGIQRGNALLHRHSANSITADHLDTKNVAAAADVWRRFKFDADCENLEDLELKIRLKNSGIPIVYRSEIKVGHAHKSTGWSWFCLQIDRGYWAGVIRSKHSPTNEPMLQCFSVINMLGFLPWLLLQIWRAPRNSLFVIVSEIGWRVGALWYLTKHVSGLQNRKRLKFKLRREK